MSDDNVQAILVNIFAGINRCDWVAEGIVQALEKNPVHVPLVVRLAGTHVEEGRRILAQERPADHPRQHPGRGGGARRAGLEQRRHPEAAESGGLT